LVAAAAAGGLVIGLVAGGLITVWRIDRHNAAFLDDERGGA
jgi:Na+/glutamate symporter